MRDILAPTAYFVHRAQPICTPGGQSLRKMLPVFPQYALMYVHLNNADSLNAAIER